MFDTIPRKTKRNDDYVIGLPTNDGYDKSNYKWDPVQKKVVYIKKGTKLKKGETRLPKMPKEDDPNYWSKIKQIEKIINTEVDNTERKGTRVTSGEKTANKKKDDVVQKLLKKATEETEKEWGNLNKEEFAYHFDKFRSSVEGKMIQLREDIGNKVPKNLIKEDIEQVNLYLKDMNRFKEKLGNINQKLHTKSYIDKVQKEIDKLLKKYNR